MEKEVKKIPFIDEWPMVILACLTLGLAPFFPEPHIVGKLRWLAGGGVGMKLIDYLDFFMHATPFILFFRLVGIKLIRSFKKDKFHE